MSLLIQLLAMLLPAGIKRALFTSALGWSIGSGTTIGCSIILAKRVTIGADCRIGHLNIFGRLKELQINNATEIGNLNHFSASRHSGWPDAFWIGNHAKVTSRHYFDCSGGIRIGDYSLIGGRETHFWTHFYDSRTVEARELSVGKRCYIGARATLVYCHIPNDCVVGAGAVVTRDFSDASDGLLIAGNPAEIKKRFLTSAEKVRTGELKNDHARD